MEWPVQHRWTQGRSADPGEGFGQRGSCQSQLDCPSASGSHTHVVRRGETLSGIAQHYGVTVTALRNANGIDSGSVLKAGEKLTIPD